MKRSESHLGLDNPPVQIAMVTAAYGMDTSGYTVPYVAHWSATVKDRDPVDVVRGTGELVRKTALAIFDHLPEPTVGDGTPPSLERKAGLDHEQPAARYPQRRRDRQPRPVADLSLT